MNWTREGSEEARWSVRSPKTRTCGWAPPTHPTHPTLVNIDLSRLIHSTRLSIDMGPLGPMALHHGRGGAVGPLCSAYRSRVTPAPEQLQTHTHFGAATWWLSQNRLKHTKAKIPSSNPVG
jgi:hypothetical protein